MSQLDRAAGAVLGMACGDALGAGYEFGPPLADDFVVGMVGGGGFRWAPGEWTDDTSMAVPLLQALSRGERFDDPAVLDRIVSEWASWAATAPDVGNQTRAVFARLRTLTEEAVRASALAVHTAQGQSGGNGSLMRTAPVALGYLHDAEGLALAARRVSDLTHFDVDAGDACVIWCLAIRTAIVDGRLDLRDGVSVLPPERQARWHTLIDTAEGSQPRDFSHNGWVVEALQGAWSAITHGSSLVDVLERAVRGGRDTDTVAAIAGGLAGAYYGASAVPAAWQRLLHGWPDLRARDLLGLAALAVDGGAPDAQGWPTAPHLDYSGYGDITTLVQHPFDEGVWLGGVGVLDALPPQIDAVVSLCRVGTAALPGVAASDHVEVWLVDSATPSKNPHLAFVLTDAADAVAALRAEGRTVFVHCAQALSRTPAVAAAYSIRHLGVPPEEALRVVTEALPLGDPNAAFVAAVREMGPADE